VVEQLRRPLPVQGCAASEPTPVLTGEAGDADPAPAIQVGDAVLGPARAFLYSVLVPGATQWEMGQRRWIAYLALEGAAWFAFSRARSSGFDMRDRYETLAWDVARTFGGDRIDGDFPYYEDLTHFEASGAFDVDSATPGVQPQTDPATFNGKTWTLAMQIFFGPETGPLPGDPVFDDALAYYEAEGYDERFEWDWTGRDADWDEYQTVIESSDEDFRRASQIMGVVIANHLLSGVDGFISARIQGATGDRSNARIRVARDESRKSFGLVFQVLR